MLEKFHRVENPLTIIGVFAGITEVAAAVALPFLTDEVQKVFVWFLIVFPFFLVVTFFLTLNFNPRVLYSPGDYRDDKHFLEALRISQRAVEVRVTESEANEPTIAQLPPPADTGARLTFEGVTARQVDAANAFMHEFKPFGDKLFNAGLITSWGFGIHGEDLFLFSATFKSQREGQGGPSDNRIIRALELPDQRVELSIIGQPVKSTNPAELAELVFRSVEDGAKRYQKNETKRG